jgi:hypothetical protein
VSKFLTWTYKGIVVVDDDDGDDDEFMLTLKPMFL